MTHERKTTLALLGLLGGGLVLRLPGLGGDLWMDEVFALVRFMRPPLLQILTTFTSDNQHLLYSAAAHLALYLPIGEAVAIRLPALGLGVASLWALVRLATPLAGRGAATWAAALMAASYHHAWFSQNARGYTGLLLATLLATDAYLRLERGESGANAWIYAAALALGAGMHLLMGFVGLAHLLAAGAAAAMGRLTGSRLRHFAAAFAGGGLLTILVYAAAFGEAVAFFTNPTARAYGAAEGWTRPLWLLREAISGLASGFGAGLVLGLGAVILAAAPALLGAWTLARRRPTAVVLFLLPGALTLAALVVLDRHLWPRFFFHFLGFACLALVCGAMELSRRTGRERLGPWLCAALVAASLTTLPRLYRLPKQDFSGARSLVEASLAPGDVVVGVGLAGETYRLYYAPHWRLARTLEELEAAGAGAERVWAVYTLPGYLAQTRPELLAALESEYSLVGRLPGTLPGGELIVRRRDARGEAP